MMDFLQIFLKRYKIIKTVEIEKHLIRFKRIILGMQNRYDVKGELNYACSAYFSQDRVESGQ